MVTVFAWFPVANLVVIMFGVMYGISSLKAHTDAVKETLAEFKDVLKDHEHRLTTMETRCEMRHVIEVTTPVVVPRQTP